MLFSDLSRSLTLLEASLRRGGFSPLLPVLTSTVLIFPGRFLIKRFYYTIVNILINFHTLKHTNRIFKSNRLITKPCTQACFYQLLGILFRRILFNLVTLILSIKVSPGKDSKYSFKSIKRAAQRLKVRLHGFSFHGTLRASVLADSLQGGSNGLNH